MNGKSKKPASDIIRQQAQVMMSQAETISREKKVFRKAVSELQASQQQMLNRPSQQKKSHFQCDS